MYEGAYIADGQPNGVQALIDDELPIGSGDPSIPVILEDGFRVCGAADERGEW